MRILPGGCKRRGGERSDARGISSRRKLGERASQRAGKDHKRQAGFLVHFSCVMIPMHGIHSSVAHPKILACFFRCEPVTPYLAHAPHLWIRVESPRSSCRKSRACCASLRYIARFANGFTAMIPEPSFTVMICPARTFASLSTCPLGQRISTASACAFAPRPKVSTSSLDER